MGPGAQSWDMTMSDKRKAEEAGLGPWFEAGRAEAREALAYWWPRVAETFGPGGSERFDRLHAMGLRHETNEALRARWEDEAKAALAPLGLG